MVSLSLQNEKILAKANSDRKELLIAFENFRDDIIKKYDKLAQRLGDNETKLLQMMESLVSMREEISMEYVTRDQFISGLVPEARKIDLLERDLTAKKEYFMIVINNLIAKFNHDLENVKKELTPKIPDVDPIKKQLDERLEILKVDFNGLIKEIGLLKKSVAYDQKKFENIYTLIERLKAGNQ
jgi:hypothetical protein